MNTTAYDFVVEMSTPDDDTITIHNDKLVIARNIYDSVSVSDDKIPRISVFVIDNDTHCMYELFRKETDSWKANTNATDNEF